MKNLEAELELCTKSLIETAEKAVGRVVMHKKTKELYVVIGAARDEREPDRVLVIYRSKQDGQTWARSGGEFFDGRFEPMTDITPPSEDSKDGN